MTFRFILPFLTALLAVSCTQETLPGRHKEEGEKEAMTFSVEQENGKTAVSSGEIVWEAGDAIGVYDGKENNRFTTESGGSSASFTGEAAVVSDYFALYPYSSTSTLRLNRCLTTIPSEQKAVKGGFARGANIAVGRSSIGADGKKCFKMKNVGAYVRVDIASGNNDISSVTLKALGAEPLTGKVRVIYDGTSDPVTEVTDGKFTARLVPPDGSSVIAPGTYYLVVNPGALESGVKVILSRSTSSQLAIREGVSVVALQRNSTVNLGSFDPAKGNPMPWIEEETDDKSADPSSAYGLDYSVLPSMGHPRLLMTDDDIIRLRGRVKAGEAANDIYSQLHKINMKKAGSMLAEYKGGSGKVVDPSTLDDSNSLRQCRLAMGQMFNWSYAYRMTGDKEYLNAVREQLAVFINFKNWHPSSFLSTAEMSAGVAIAYDWLYYNLTKDERAAVRNALETKGLGTGATGFHLMNNNWTQVCEAGLAMASLAIYDKNKTLARNTIEDSVKYTIDASKVIYTPDGSCAEGIGYFSFGNNYEAMFIECLLTAFGTSGGILDVKGLSRAADYLLFMSDHIGTFGYADDANNANPVPAVWWYAAHYQNPSLLLNELRYIKDGSNTGGRTDPQSICALIKYPELDLSGVSRPQHDYWIGDNEAISPVAMVHTGWNFDDSDVYLGIKGGQGATNHGHADAGTFVYDYAGQRWASEAAPGGYAWYQQRTDYFNNSQKSTKWNAFVTNNMCHSTLTVMDTHGMSKLHGSDHNMSGKATISKSYTDADDMGVLLNMGEVFKDQLKSEYRLIHLVNRKVLEIKDLVAALDNYKADLQWRMLTPADVKIDNDKGCIVLTKGGKTMYLSVRLEFPNNDVTESDVNVVYGTYGTPMAPTDLGWTPCDPQSNPTMLANIVGFKATVPKGKQVRFITVLSPVSPDLEDRGVSGETPGMGDDKKDEAIW